VREEIHELQQSLALTAVYVTHDEEEALAISDRILVMSMARIAQDGTPRSLYEHPNSHFVADFIGDANTVPVVIEGRQGELALVRLGPLVLTLPQTGTVEGVAQLSIRPQALLLALGAGRPDALAGRVSKAAYLGSHMEYWVVVDGLSKELFVIAPDVEAPFAAGDEVAITLALSGVALVSQR
jgi:iron(III) transport system ATP-binding protein